MWAVVVVAAATLLSGCASFEYTKAAPAQQAAVTVKASGEELSGWTDLPIGTYRVPESDIIISGHQKGHMAGLLFGVVGVAVAHAANAGAGADTVKDAESILKIKLHDAFDASVARVLAAGGYGGRYTQERAQGSVRLVVTPAAVLSFVSDTQVRPFVVLKAVMLGADSKPLWTTRYIASSAQLRPMLGDGGWLDQDGGALKSTLQDNLDKAVRTMLADVAKPYPRDDNELTMVQANFPHVRQRFQTVGYRLSEDDNQLTFVPKLGDVLVFAGVNIFDKAAIHYRAATKDDAVFKMLPETPASDAGRGSDGGH
jgi:hypothetical protein